MRFSVVVVVVVVRSKNDERKYVEVYETEHFGVHHLRSVKKRTHGFPDTDHFNRVGGSARDMAALQGHGGSPRDVEALQGTWRLCEGRGGSARDVAVLRGTWRLCEGYGGFSGDMAALQGAWRLCEERGGSARDMAALRGTWRLCKGHGGFARDMAALLRTWRLCEGYGSSARDMAALIGTWQLCEGHGSSARDMVALRGTWWLCEGHGGSARDMAVLRGTWRLCRGYGGSARGMAVLRGTWQLCEGHGGSARDMADLRGTWRFCEGRGGFAGDMAALRGTSTWRLCRGYGGSARDMVALRGTWRLCEGHGGSAGDMAALQGIWQLCEGHGGSARDMAARAKWLRKAEIGHKREPEMLGIEINGYPWWVINSITQDVRAQHEREQQQIYDNVISTPEQQIVNLTLPYKGNSGVNLVKKLKHVVETSLPSDVKARFSYRSHKLASRFSVKDQTAFEHWHNLVYMTECPEEKCKETYIGETGRRLQERITDHNSRDKTSSVSRHCKDTGHPSVNKADFKILATDYPFYRKRKTAEALLIKEKKPTLNEQGQSTPLSLLN
ncbi:hypothetical protein QZH41_002519 [Actinostola sp. cb2023]|nr:hypothetical protein QZH41_002519 [Actinostola sp. cb2023]